MIGLELGSVWRRLGAKVTVVGVDRKGSRMIVQTPDGKPHTVKPEDIMELYRQRPQKLEMAAAEAATGEPSLSIKKIIEGQQAGMSLDKAKEQTELQLLSDKFKNQAKGARIGAREATRIIRAECDKKIDAYQEKVAGLRKDLIYSKAEAKKIADWMAAEEAAIKTELIRYIEATLPLEERGKYLKTVRDAKSFVQLLYGRQTIDDAAALIHKKGLLSDIRKLVPRILDSPRVDVNVKKMVREYLSDVEIKGRSAATYDRLRKTLQYAEHMDAQGEDAGLSKAILEELDILGRRPLKDMKEAELEGIFLRLQMLDELGRTKVNAREGMYMLERERYQAEIISDLKPLEGREVTQKEPGEKMPVKTSIQNKIARALNFAQEKYQDVTPPDVVWDMMSKTPQYNGSVVKHFVHGIGADYARNIDLYDAPINGGRDIINKYKLTTEQIERITAYAYLQQPGGADYLYNQGLLSAQKVKAWATTPVGPGEAELYTHWRKSLDSIYPLLADTLRFNDNIEVGHRPAYFPVRLDPNRAIDADDDLAKMIRGAHEGFQKNVNIGNVKRRSGSDRAVALDGTKTFETYMRIAAYKIAMSRRIRMLGEIVNSPEFSAAAGDFGTRFAKKFITMMARRGSPRGGDVIRTLDNIRRNASAFAIVFRLPTALVHATIVSNAAAISGPAPIFKGL